MPGKIRKKAASPEQQKLMGIAHALQKGTAKKSTASKTAKDLAKSMDPGDVTAMASTKHKDIRKKAKKESMMIEKLYAVRKPHSDMNEADLVVEFNPLEGIQRLNIMQDDVHSVHATAEDAQQIAAEAYKSCMDEAFQLEEKKGKVGDKLKKTINHLEKQRKAHVDMATKDPKNASQHKKHIAKLASQIDDLMSKMERIEKSKKNVEKVEDKKEDKKKSKLKENADSSKIKIGVDYHGTEEEFNQEIAKFNLKGEFGDTAVKKMGTNTILTGTLDNITKFLHASKGSNFNLSEKNLKEDDPLSKEVSDAKNMFVKDIIEKLKRVNIIDKNEDYFEIPEDLFNGAFISVVSAAINNNLSKKSPDEIKKSFLSPIIGKIEDGKYISKQEGADLYSIIWQALEHMGYNGNDFVKTQNKKSLGESKLEAEIGKTKTGDTTVIVKKDGVVLSKEEQLQLSDKEQQEIIMLKKKAIENARRMPQTIKK